MKMIIVAALACTVASSAFADCNTAPFRFFPAQNDHVSTSVTTTGACTHGFSAGGTSAFTQASIAGKPSHGTLTQVAPFRFTYQPAKSYKGQDSYSVKICGNSNAGSGCSTITYNADVQ
jgi:hypothetical protein